LSWREGEEKDKELFNKECKEMFVMTERNWELLGIGSLGNCWEEDSYIVNKMAARFLAYIFSYRSSPRIVVSNLASVMEVCLHSCSVYVAICLYRSCNWPIPNARELTK
jgi:hypothetical protein